MKCKDINFGTYDCAYNIMPPWYSATSDAPKYIAVDKCLLPEILSLWERGIRTTGCCCGHAKLPAFISVSDQDILKMKELGYIVQDNSCRPGDEDTFNIKTKLNYTNADKGFNWWDKEDFE